MITRRNVVLTSALLAGGCASWHSEPSPQSGDFVQVNGQRLLLRGQPYRFVGTNMWYGAYMGSAGPTGDQERLKRELDALQALGVTNIRVLGASELSPLKNSLKPAFRRPTPPYNEVLLEGLDFFMAEMAKRNMKAVIYLSNFWEWSGGFVTYQYWTNGGHYINLGDPAHPWPEFAILSAEFYVSKPANALYRDYVTTLITRRNTITGVAYRDDPAVMSWQLANEPRPGGNMATANIDSFYSWVSDTSAFIKSLDRNHLVSTGNEGLRGCLDSEDVFERLNALQGVDYMTFHIWPLNWSWIDSRNLAQTFEPCESSTKEYIDIHMRAAARVNKPAVAEEFGFVRDGGLNAPSAPTTYRDRFYKLIFDAVEDSTKAGGPFAGTNFWAWGGEGHAQHPDFAMRAGDTSYLGDPPQEPQGRNSVLKTDRSTLELIRNHATRLHAVVA
ncbi:MAG: mannanase [Alphaproteobacteria bacterium]|nr:mannanase [Alphaproteobacteria bacterium]